MKVVATNRGYHGFLREPGDTFDVPDGAIASWFRPVEPSATEPKPAGKQPKSKPAPADEPPLV